MNRNVPNIISFSRIPLSFLLLVALLIPYYYPNQNVKNIGIIFVLVIFILIEISDVLDGYVARKFNIVSDFGKILDPYSDVFSRVSYFIFFSFFHIIPLWITFPIFARELSMIFIRSLLTGKNIYLPANIFGKAKAWFYSFSGAFGIIALYYNWGVGSFFVEHINIINIISLSIYSLAAFSSVVSFLIYMNIVKGVFDK